MDPSLRSVITLCCPSRHGRVWAGAEHRDRPRGAAGVVGEPRWKRPLQRGVISFGNEARGQNNLKADWRSLERGLPSESARSSRCCCLDFPFHISSPVYSLVLGGLCLRGNWGLVGCKQISNITEIF